MRQPVDVVLTGGVFRGADAPFLARLEERITASVPGAKPRPLREKPVLGSALIGLDEFGVRAAGAAERRLRDAFEGHISGG